MGGFQEIPKGILKVRGEGSKVWYLFQEFFKASRTMLMNVPTYAAGVPQSTGIKDALQGE